MAELLYNIRNIFNDATPDGCLHQYEAGKFHIPAYQRGYKWSSASENGPVQILMKDLYKAFLKSENQKKKEYYLQYITVSKRENMLELIDGQQRITTLSILLSVFNLLNNLDENLAANKLHYAIRPQIFESNI